MFARGLIITAFDCSKTIVPYICRGLSFLRMIVGFIDFLLDSGPILIMVLLPILDLLIIGSIYLRDTPYKLFYIALVILLPFLGILVYYLLTIRQRKNGRYVRMRRRRRLLQTCRGECLANSVQNHNSAASERAELLNKLILHDSVRSEAEYQLVYEQIISLADDKDKFLVDVAGCICNSDPHLFRFLESKKLSDWEIGYCGLYLYGLTSSEIGKFLESKIYYRHNSKIRSKLGLSPHDTNLSIYLKNLSNSLKSKL